MPVPIGNYEVGKTLRDIANVSQFPAELSEMINPVLVANPSNYPVLSTVSDRGILDVQIGSGSLGGTGSQSRTYTVPNGKKWLLKKAYFNTSATLGGVTNFDITKPSGTLAIVQDFPSTQLSGGYDFGDLVLPQGWSFRIRYNISVDGSTYNSLLYSEFIEAQ